METRFFVRPVAVVVVVAMLVVGVPWWIGVIAALSMFGYERHNPIVLYEKGVFKITL
jgi:hypothetical protein